MRCLIIDDESLARSRLRSLIEADGRVTVADEASDGASALEKIAEHKPDLVFLDIQMPELTGIEVATRLQDSDLPLPIIIFVTAYDEFALKAFDLHAIDYLLKPFDRSRFVTALEKAIGAHQSRDSADLQKQLASLISTYNPAPPVSVDRLPIKSEGKILLLPVDAINYISAANNYVEIHAENATHLMRETLSALEAQLDPKKFLRISRSSIVSINRIREIHPLFHGEHTLVLSTGTKLTASRSYRDALKPFLGK
ncbi:LytTR family DNA-binding domain-containing protein [Pelagicoccus sp. SDUM812002]|uniref:LytR/AlgR family response regulator transcription factor n=1 Tax=Pelagicoccus sp. SDUM812002 TaxID=3041266 RepID=UPI00280E41B3|nr:LytTR family DNA-binding domain-containing protein [Pelagicoccus sp. SDUM812002]MDQ8186499.1 LytTR family DNA-binding domain-containing protein [Pelagicoccus sp. SDUM812002]